jgi:hypothetical protein
MKRTARSIPCDEIGIEATDRFRGWLLNELRIQPLLNCLASRLWRDDVVHGAFWRLDAGNVQFLRAEVMRRVIEAGGRIEFARTAICVINGELKTVLSGGERRPSP